MYGIEREVKLLSAQQRLHERRTRAAPIAQAPHDWLIAQRGKIRAPPTRGQAPCSRVSTPQTLLRARLRGMGVCRRCVSGSPRRIQAATHRMPMAAVRAPPTVRWCCPRWTARGQRISEFATSNPHSDRAVDNHRHLRSGFLPQGLSNTCPQAGTTRRPVLLAGQVSDKPKRERKFVKDRSAAGQRHTAICPVSACGAGHRSTPS